MHGLTLRDRAFILVLMRRNLTHAMVVIAAPFFLIGVGLSVDMSVLSLPASARVEMVGDEEYPIYDRVVQAKFLTSDTTLVKIAHMTVTRLVDEDDPPGPDVLGRPDLFDGDLPPALVRDFRAKLGHSRQLERKFSFGARYRLVSDQDGDADEVSLNYAPAAWRPADYDGSVIMLEFSRVAFTPMKDHALVYVGNHRSDGTGAGFMVLFVKHDGAWQIAETEVVWAAGRRPPE